MLKIMEYYLLARQFFYAPLWQTMEPCCNSHSFSLDINLDVEQNSSSSCRVPFLNIFPLYLPEICIKHINVGDKPRVAVAKRFIEAWINNQGDERWSFNARTCVQFRTMRRHVRYTFLTLYFFLTKYIRKTIRTIMYCMIGWELIWIKKYLETMMWTENDLLKTVKIYVNILIKIWYTKGASTHVRTMFPVLG